jgi:hypothetical protein
MYVRTNERRWAWMDEGWADYNTSIIENWFFNNKKEIENIFFGSKYIEGMIGCISDLPLITSSEYLVGNYSYASYTLPSFIYTTLHQYLGDEFFLNVIKNISGDGLRNPLLPMISFIPLKMSQDRI